MENGGSEITNIAEGSEIDQTTKPLMTKDEIHDAAREPKVFKSPSVIESHNKKRNAAVQKRPDEEGA